MSRYARGAIYSLANKLAHRAAKEGLDEGEYFIEPGGEEDRRLTELLNQVEENRAHAEANRLRQRAQVQRLDLLDPFSPYREQLIRDLADLVDPYEERDGRLVRKFDGKPVIT